MRATLKEYFLHNIRTKIGTDKPFVQFTSSKEKGENRKEKKSFHMYLRWLNDFQLLFHFHPGMQLAEAKANVSKSFLMHRIKYYFHAPALSCHFSSNTPNECKHC